MFGMGTGVAPPLWPPGENRKIENPTGLVPDEEDAIWKSPDVWRRFLRAACRRDRGLFTLGRLKYGQASRLVSSGRLRASPRVHPRPIEVVFYDPPLDSREWEISSLGRLGA